MKNAALNREHKVFAELDIEALTIVKSMLSALVRTINEGDKQEAFCVVALPTAMLIRHIVESLKQYDVKLKHIEGHGSNRYSVIITFREQ